MDNQLRALHSPFIKIWPLLREGQVIGQYEIRPISPNDRTGVLDLFDHLSIKSRYFRYAHAMSTLPEALLNEIIHANKPGDFALVAMILNSDQTQTLAGIARFIQDNNGLEAEFSLSVSDDHHHEGIGSHLMRAIIDCARLNGLAAIYGLINKKNDDMLFLMRHLGYTLSTSEDDFQFYIARHSTSSG
jgi:GNAT superfamily N-acetyltransferase